MLASQKMTKGLGYSWNAVVVDGLFVVYVVALSSERYLAWPDLGRVVLACSHGFVQPV